MATVARDLRGTTPQLWTMQGAGDHTDFGVRLWHGRRRDPVVTEGHAQSYNARNKTHMQYSRLLANKTPTIIS